jgi:hypothetical protein
MSRKNVFSALIEPDVSDNESTTSESNTTSVPMVGSESVRSKDDPWNLKNKTKETKAFVAGECSEDETSKDVPRRTFQVADSSETSEPADKGGWVQVGPKPKTSGAKKNRDKRPNGKYRNRDNKSIASVSVANDVSVESVSETTEEVSTATRKMDIPVDSSEKSASEKGAFEKTASERGAKVSKPKVSYASMAVKEPQVVSASASASASVSTETGFTKVEHKKKSFTAPNVQRDGALKLPAYYQTRNGNSEYEIPQNEYSHIRRIGGLEKSADTKHMLLGAINCAIAYFNNKEFLLNNKFFKDRITTDPAKQEELLELIMIQTVAILFHRLIKSDDTSTVQTIINNLPLYKIVTTNSYDHGSGTPTFGGPTFARIKNKWFANQRIISGKDPRHNDAESIARATATNAETKRKWEMYILQSIWNGNNPVHDCLYYGASGTFRLLLNHYMTNGMKSQLNTMMLVPNIQNETHRDIVFNGKLACEKQSSYIIRRKQFEDCEDLYNRTIHMLREDIHAIAEAEAKEIVSGAVAADSESKDSEHASAEPKPSDASDDFDFTNAFQRQDNIAMVKHLLNCHSSGNNDLIRATVSVWKDILESDPNDQMEDCLNDVLECAEMQEIGIDDILAGVDKPAVDKSVSATDC